MNIVSRFRALGIAGALLIALLFALSAQADPTALPTVTYLGEGHDFSVPTGADALIVKEIKSENGLPFRFVLTNMAYHDPAKVHRAWACAGNCGDITTMYQSTKTIGTVCAGCVVEALIIDNDIDERIPVIMDSTITITVVDQGLTGYFSFTAPITATYIVSSPDSIGFVAVQVSTPTPATPTATAINIATDTPVSTLTATPTQPTAPTETPTAIVIDPFTPTPTPTLGVPTNDPDSPELDNHLFMPKLQAPGVELPAFHLRVAQLAQPGACVAQMTDGAEFCPLAGSYIALQATEPNVLAFGGKQSGGQDMAWEGESSEFALLSPSQIIIDADIVEIDVSGYITTAGLFTATDGGFTVLRIEDPVSAAAVTDAPMFGEADFVGILKEMLDNGQIFDVDWPASMVFWDRTETVSFTPAQCGVSHAVWVPDGGMQMITNRGAVHFLARGTFEPVGLANCMKQFRWVKVGELMTSPAAKNMQDRIRSYRGGTAPAAFTWLGDANGQVYAFYSIATGALAYYGYRILNSAAQGTTTMFLFVPDEFLDVTCSTVGGVKTCLIQETDPN